MSSEGLILYQEPSVLISVPSSIINVPDILQYNHMLPLKDVQKIINAAQMNSFDMASEFVWSRTINVLRKLIFQFGPDFVSEMLDRPTTSSIDAISEFEIITLSADLGFINSTAKMEFLQFSETIRHFMSNDDPEEEFPATKMVDLIRSCIKHVLGYEKAEYTISFVSFRERLKSEQISSSHEIYQQLITAPYFYKKTIVRTLLNLARTLPDSAEREKVFINTKCILLGIWMGLPSEDRYSIGRAYAQANSDGDINFSKVLRSILFEIQGFDFVPESLRSNTYVNVAKNLLSAHYGINNYYNEPQYAKMLAEMGSSIPNPAFGACMAAVLTCKIGNAYGVSYDAQNYLNTVLKHVTDERWQYYLNNYLETDDDVLYAIFVSHLNAERFKNVLEENGVSYTNLTNHTIKDMIKKLSEKQYSSATQMAYTLYTNLSKRQ